MDPPDTPEAEVRKRPAGRYSGVWIRSTRRYALYLRDNWRCVWCCLDHVYPRCDPRRTHPSEDVVTSCTSCNTSRKATSLEKGLPHLDPEAPERVARARATPVNMRAGRALALELCPPRALVQAQLQAEDRPLW